MLNVDDAVLAAESVGSATASVLMSIVVTNYQNRLSPITYSLVRSNAYVYALCPSVTGASEDFRARLGQTLERQRASLSAASHRMMAQNLHIAAQEWFAQSALCRETLNRLTGREMRYLHRVGVCGQRDAPYLDIGNQVSFMRETVARPEAGMLISSALEHGVMNQAYRTTNAISTIGAMLRANRQGGRLWRATSANYTSTVRSNLTGYSQNLLNYFQSAVNAGRELFLPQNGALSAGIWTGCAYMEYGPKDGNYLQAMIISGLSGGIATEWGSLSSAQMAELVRVLREQDALIGRVASSDPIDLRTGACLAQETDLALAAPLPVAWVRRYDSRRADTDGPLGRGWTLGPDIRISRHSDVAAMSGGRQPGESADFAVAATVIEDVLASGSTALNLATATVIADWLAGRFQEAAVSVYLDDRALTFLSRADGSWSAPAGANLSLTKSNGMFTVTHRQGGAWRFDTNDAVTGHTDADGNAVAFLRDAQEHLTGVSNSFGRALSIEWSDGRMTSVTGPDSRQVRYNYSADGELTNVTDAAGNAWGYGYDSAHRLAKIADPEGWTVASNFYNGLGQVTNQISPLGGHWTFRNAGGMEGWQSDPDGRRTAWSFDPDGRPIQVVRPDGFMESVVYDGLGRAVTNLAANGMVTVTGYDTNHDVVAVIRAAGTAQAATNRYAYNPSGLPVSSTDPEGRVTQTVWDEHSHPTVIIAPDGSITTNEYDSRGLLIRVRKLDAVGGLWRQTDYAHDSGGWVTNELATDAGPLATVRDGYGRPTRVTDSLGRTTWFYRDALGRVTNTVDAASGQARSIYLRNGLHSVAIDPGGHAVTSLWTHARESQAVRAPDGGVTSNEYDNAGRLMAVTDARGRRVQRALDALGRETNRWTSAWSERTWWDSVGNGTARMDAVSSRTDQEYDSLNRPTRLRDPLGRESVSYFDKAGIVTNTLDFQGRPTRNRLDAVGRIERVIYPSGRTEDFAHDGLGRLIAFTNSEGHVYRMAYDAQDRLVAATNAAGEQVFRNYFDSCGNLTNHLDGAGRPTRRQYDVLNRCTNTVYADGSSEAFAFDADGNLLTAGNAAATNMFAYDTMNRLATSVSRVGSLAFTNQYRYDLGGLATNVIYPDGKMVRYAFDADGRVTNVTDWAGHTWSIARDAAGRMTTLAYPNGVSGTWQYDASHAVSSWGYSGVAGLPGRTISRNVMGLKTREDVTSGPMPVPVADRRVTNMFNPADRLTSAQVAQGTNLSSGTFLYDGCGALTNVARNGAAADTFAYDLAGRMVSASTSNVTFTATFDALGNRVRTTINGTNRLWVIDHTDPLKRPLMETTTNGTPVRYYVWGAGRLLAAIDADGTTRYAHCDDQGSVVALTSTNGTVLFTANYGPYGEPWGTTGTNVTPFAWLGGHGVFHVGGSSLYLTRHRAYDTTLKRFLSQDPLGLAGGANLYAYCLGNPLGYIDPFGLCGGLWFDQLGSSAAAASASIQNTMIETYPWPVAGALNTVVQIGQGIVSTPQAIGHLGEGSGTFAGNPSWQNAPGMLMDVSVAASVLAAGMAPLPSANVPLGSTVSGGGTSQNLYHYTSADPTAIANQGLRPGASGNVYATPVGNLSPLQAQVDLALPPNRGLPQHLVEIDVPTLESMGIQVPAAGTVGRSYNMPGGGTEVVFPHALPPEAIRTIR